MRKTLPVAVAAAVLVLAAEPAAAEPQKSKELILGVLGNLAEAARQGGELKWDDPQASAGGSGDLVVVPNLRFEGKEGGAQIGRVEFTVNDGQASGGSARRRIQMKLPGKITLESPNNPAVDVTFEDHGFTAVWAPEIEAITAADFAYRNVRIADRGGNGEVKLGEVVLDTKASDAGDIWTGTTRFAVRKLAGSGKGGSFALDEFAETVSGEKLPLRSFSALNKKVREIVAGRTPEEIPEEDWVPLIDMAEAMSFGDAMRVDLAVKGFSFKGAEGSGRLGTAGFGFGVKRSGGDKADAALSFSMDGVDVPVPTTPELIPNRGKIDLQLLGLPAARLWSAFVAAGREGVASGPDAGKDMLTMQLFEIAHSTDAGLKVALALGAPAMSGDASSDFKFDPDAAQGLVGQARLTVLGLDPTLEKIRKGPQNEQTQQAMAVLSMLKGFGRSEVANNAIAYIYDFVLSKTGEMTINGQDLQALMNQGQGGGQQPGQKPPPKRRS